MLPFKIDESGVYFTVLIFDDYVIKIPKKDKVKDINALKFISDAQTSISENVNGVLPCWLIEGVLVMPKAKGVRSDKVPEKKGHIKQLRSKVLEQIKELGYELRDHGFKNIFYDEDQDQVYMIDFHAVRTFQPKNKKR